MQPNKLFVYGILKRGYELDLNNTSGKFLGEASIQGAVLYGIGSFRFNGGPREYSGVGLKLDKDPNQVAHGELWEIPDRLWKWLDDIERNGFVYTRKVVPVSTYTEDSYGAIYDAWVYEYTHPNFRAENPIEGGVF